MILATTTVENVDRFLEVFGTKGADKRALHGSKGSTVFRDPTEDNRVWALFDWDEDGWTKFVSDPEVPPILKEAGHLGKPQAALMLGSRPQETTPPAEAPPAACQPRHRRRQAHLGAHHRAPPLGDHLEVRAARYPARPGRPPHHGGDEGHPPPAWPAA